MRTICLYLQIHQPFRLKHLSLLNPPKNFQYFDEDLNREIFLKIARRCYLPASKLLLEMVQAHQGKFRLALSLSGVVVEQMAQYAPEVLENFRKLAKTDCVEILGETYYHSLACFLSRREFVDQVRSHSDLMEHCFSQRPKFFRNTELIHGDRLAKTIETLGFQGVLADGLVNQDPKLLSRNLHRSKQGNLVFLLKNSQFSDAIAFQFTNFQGKGSTLTPQDFMAALANETRDGDLVNLFMDFETFGEHQRRTSGIFEFLKKFSQTLLAQPTWNFETPSEILLSAKPGKAISFSRWTSWADRNRDISPWLGNPMQKRALRECAALTRAFAAKGHPQLLRILRRLQTSDHFYYMSTKGGADGRVHAYFRPYENSYEAFINYMTALQDFKSKARSLVKSPYDSAVQYPILKVA